jgi:hypothetical protein
MQIFRLIAKNQILFFLSVMALLITACTPAQSVSGENNGSYTDSGMDFNSGSGTLNTTRVGDNLIDISFNSSSNPNYSVNNVLVT